MQHHYLITYLPDPADWPSSPGSVLGKTKKYLKGTFNPALRTNVLPNIRPKFHTSYWQKCVVFYVFTDNVTTLTSCCGTGRITLNGGIWHLLLLLFVVDFCEKIV